MDPESAATGSEDGGGGFVQLFGKLVHWTSAGLIMFGGVVPYVPQYVEIRAKEDADGFSLYVCLALLVANTLRILFWFGKRFELPLLAQSIIMNIMMLAMIHLCVKVKSRNLILKGQDRIFTDFDPRYFWQWTDFQSYIDFLLLFSISMSLLTVALVRFELYVNTIGFAALFTEAMLGLPQLINNFRNKSTYGMSLIMVVLWMTGDAFKTIYFIIREAPVQFWLCGILQVLVDVFILGQVYLYRNNSSVPPAVMSRVIRPE